jgi:hypothetical protein
MVRVWGPLVTDGRLFTPDLLNPLTRGHSGSTHYQREDKDHGLHECAGPHRTLRIHLGP